MLLPKNALAEHTSLFRNRNSDSKCLADKHCTLGLSETSKPDRLLDWITLGCAKVEDGDGIGTHSDSFEDFVAKSLFTTEIFGRREFLYLELWNTIER